MNYYLCALLMLFWHRRTARWQGGHEGQVQCKENPAVPGSLLHNAPHLLGSSLVKHPLPIASEQDGLLAARGTWRGKAPTECSMLHRLNCSPWGGERWGIHLLPAFQRDPRCFCHTGDQRALSRSLKSLVSGGWWFMSLLNEMFVSGSVGNR